MIISSGDRSSESVLTSGCLANALLLVKFVKNVRARPVLELSAGFVSRLTLMPETLLSMRLLLIVW